MIAFSNPFISDTLLPDALLHDTVLAVEHAFAVLVSVLPLAVVLSAIWPNENSMTVLFIIHIVSLINSAILPCELTLTMHFIALPGTFILSTVLLPVIPAEALYQIILKLSFICRSICKQQITFTVFLVIAVGALILGTISPRLFTLAVLHVLYVITLIH